MRSTRRARRAALVLSLSALGLAGPRDDLEDQDDQDDRAVAAADRPNLLLIVLDDVGIDLLPAYGAGSGPPVCTPTIDALADRGLLFQSAWANPLCSPTRAQILTGRHSFRTGVGTIVNGEEPESFEGLAESETTIAELLAGAGYSTGLFGKWHLATGNLDPADPLDHGFAWFEGGIGGNLSPETPGGCPPCPLGCRTGTLGYERWVKSTNGVESCETTYATTATVDDALAATPALLPEPWFVVASFHAVHSPFHAPPASLCASVGGCACSGPGTTPPELARAALEAADVEIGRLLRELRRRSVRPPHVILIGDNGTSSAVALGGAGGCFDPERSKGTPYEGGVRVPLVIAGPGVRRGEVDGLVSATDVFATLADLALVSATAEDSVSLLPYLRGYRGALRSTVYAESFVPNGQPFAPTDHERAIRDERFKLIRRTGGPDELYDLLEDPCETHDLFPPLPGSSSEAAWKRLDEELVALGVG